MELSAVYRDNGTVVTLTCEAMACTSRPIVTCSEKMQECVALLESVAPTDLRIMIVGESGTNKQDYAELIHRLSGRANGPYVRFDCAATHASLYEERLFGAGGGDGGKAVRRGALEKACGGTVLLDGVSMIPDDFLGKIEALLEKGTMVRRGDRYRTKVDVRFLTTCSEDVMAILRKDPRLAQLMQQLASVQIHVLPLRRRVEDVALLSLYYLNEANERYGTSKRMGSVLFREILAYSWPGNERELKSFVERAVLSSRGDVLDDPQMIRDTASLSSSLIPAWKKDSARREREEKSLKEQVSEYELMIIRQSISKYGSLRKAAKALQVDPSVISRKLSAAKEK